MESRKGRSGGIALVAVLVAALTSTGFIAGQAPANAQSPETGGQWSKPFEEGGAGQPRCERMGDNGRILCKPTAVSASALPDGRVLYWNGIESSENVTLVDGDELSPDSRNSRSRTLDLRGLAPVFKVPGVSETGGRTNPQIVPGRNGTDRPFGMLGVPGRPGDGLVGSSVGEIHSEEPTSPPDDSQENDGDMFCGYLAQLPDGRVMVMGGTDWYNEPSATFSEAEFGDAGLVELEGLRSTTLYDPRADAWRVGGNMKYGRWYPAAVELPDGKMTVFSGVTKLIKSTQLSNVRRAETFDPVTMQWQENYTGPESEASLILFPRMHLMPNGKIFWPSHGQAYTPAGEAADELLWNFMKMWDPARSVWEQVGLANLGVRSGATDTMLALEPPYDHGSVLMAGGVLGPTPSLYVSINLSEIYTVTGNKVTHEMTGNLNHRRWFTSSVVLPDGKVFATNGGDLDEVLIPGTEASVTEAEMFDPMTRKWTEVARASRGRTYHNSAILLADGRVLSGGHSPIQLSYTHHRDLRNNNDKDSSFEIYSPPYLFRGPRPQIAYAPSGVAWNQPFSITVNSQSPIDSVVLAKLPATTHVLDNNQRVVKLAFTQRGNQVTAVAPPSGTIAPPGFYYLFVNRKTDRGPVPSIAAIVNVGNRANPASAIQPLTDSASVAARGSATPTENTTLVLPGECAGCPGKERESPLLHGRPVSYDPTTPAPGDLPLLKRETTPSLPAEGTPLTNGAAAPTRSARAPDAQEDHADGGAPALVPELGTQRGDLPPLARHRE